MGLNYSEHVFMYFTMKGERCFLCKRNLDKTNCLARQTKSKKAVKVPLHWWSRTATKTINYWKIAECICFVCIFNAVKKLIKKK